MEWAKVDLYVGASLSFMRSVHGESLQPIVVGREPAGAEGRVCQALIEERVFHRVGKRWGSRSRRG